MDKLMLLADIRRTHAALEVLVAALDDEALHAPAPGMDEWTRKDVLAHIEWWNDHTARVVEGLRAGREPYSRDEPWDPDAWNERIVADSRSRSSNDVREGEVAAFLRLMAAVVAASDEELFEVGRYAWLGGGPLVDTVVGDSTAHYPEHLPHLAAG